MAAALRPLPLLAQALMVVGILSNGITVAIYLKDRSLRKPINFFLIALACADLSTMLTTLCQPYIWKSYHSQFVCDLMSALMSSLTHFSVNCFAATAAIRYIHILHPALSKKIMKWKTCFFLAALMWLETFLTVWPFFTDFTDNTYYEWLQLCSLNNASNWSYYLSLVGITVTVPNIIIIYCYISILVKRMRSKRQVQANNSGPIGQGGVTWKKRDLRLFWQVICLFIVFTLCWTPISVVALTTDFGSSGYQLLFESVLVICLINFCVNPLIYMYFNPEFRREITRTFFCQKLGTTAKPVSDRSLSRKQRNEASSRQIQSNLKPVVEMNNRA